MINVVIVEDEVNNIEVLEHLLTNYCEDVTLKGVAKKCGEAIHLINEVKPDIVLLDVELEDGTGFDVLDGIGDHKPNIIFITGYEHYAIDAIKSSAIDYILKPINIEELQSAIKKAKTLQLEALELQTLQKKIKELEPSFIWLNDNRKSQKIDISTIEFIKADSVYSEVTLETGKVRLTSFSLGHFESKLKEFRFYRIHKSYIINLDKVVEVESGRGGHVVMKSGAKLPVAYRRKSLLKTLLNKE